MQYMHACIGYTDKKENKIFLIYKEIQNGAVAKSYMTNGLLIYGEIFEHFLIYQEALPQIWLCNCSTLNCLIYVWWKFDFLFYQCTRTILQCIVFYSWQITVQCVHSRTQKLHIDRKSGKQFIPTLNFQFFVKKTDKKRGDMPISGKNHDPDHGKATSALFLIPAQGCVL